MCLCSQFNDRLTYQENSLIKYHMLMGHDVSVITTTSELNDLGVEVEVEAGTYSSSLGYNIIRLKHKGIRKLRRFYALQENLKLLRPDFIFIHGTQFLDLIGVIDYCKANNIKVLADNHADYYNSAQTWLSKNVFHGIIWRYTTQSLVNYSKKIFGVSPIRCRFLNEVYNIPNSNIELLPLGADDYKINEVRERLEVEKVKQKYRVNDEFVLVTGGKIDKNKNLLTLLRAVKLLENEVNIKLLIFGTIYPEVLEEITKHSLGDNFISIGWLGPEEMYELLLSSDVNVFIGSHSVLWEQAVACGVPTIFRKIEGMEHVNVCKNSLLIEDAEDEGNLAKLIQRLAQDKAFYSNIKENSKKAAEFFSYSEIAKRALVN